jgi:hypothetical protein
MRAEGRLLEPLLEVSEFDNVFRDEASVARGLRGTAGNEVRLPTNRLLRR